MQESADRQKKGQRHCISVFPPPKDNPKPDRPDVVAFSRASGDGVYLHELLRRLLNAKGKNFFGSEVPAVGRDEKSFVRIFLPDGLMQAVNFADLSHIERCWRPEISSAEFNRILGQVSAQGIKASQAWSKQLKLEFVQASQNADKQAATDSASYDPYFISFEEVSRDKSILHSMLDEFSRTESKLHQGIMKTILDRREKMVQKHKLNISQEQLEKFIRKFQSQDNTGTRQQLCFLLGRIYPEGEESAISDFVNAFLASCYYLIYEAVAVDWLKKNASTLYYPGAITPMLQSALEMAPAKVQSDFWRELDYPLLPESLLNQLDGYIEALKKDGIPDYVTAEELGKVSQPLDDAWKVVNSIKSAPKSAKGGICITGLFPLICGEREFKNLGDVYKLHQRIEEDCVTLRNRVDAMGRARDDGSALRSAPLSPLSSAVQNGGIPAETVLELYKSKHDILLVGVVWEALRQGNSLDSIFKLVGLLKGDSDESSEGSVISPPRIVSASGNHSTFWNGMPFPSSDQEPPASQPQGTSPLPGGPPSP